MTLRQFVDQCSECGKADGIASAAVKLGVGYHTVYKWLHGMRKPGRQGLLALERHKITL